MASKLKTLTKQELLDLLESHPTVKDVLEYLGVNPAGGARKTFAKLVTKYEIDLSPYREKAQIERGRRISNTTKCSTETLFVKGQQRRTQTLKQRMLELGYEYKCQICSNPGEHFGKPLTLQLDHINGDPYNNLLENLRFLCPNCHSQTTTFGYKNRADLAVLGGNDPHSSCVTGMCASMNTLEPS